MERIPAKDRFSKHAKISEVAPEILNEAISKFELSPQVCQVQRLSGGFMNANFMVACDDKKFVFRVYSTDRVTAERERDMLQFLRSQTVRVPETFAVLDVHGRPITVLEYIDGITLEDKILSDAPVDPHQYEQIGIQLAHIHSIHFNDTGFIWPRMFIGKEYENFSWFIRAFIDKTLNELPSEKLDTDTTQRLQRLVRDQWHLVLRTEPRRQLVHTDFNPKNILVSRGPDNTLLAVLDWEFCLSGNGLIDLGNFFRFSYDYAPGAREHFEAGYRSVNDQLPLEWMDVARLLDLGNMCSFLERKEDYPQSFRTARIVIKSTLEHFGY